MARRRGVRSFRRKEPRSNSDRLGARPLRRFVLLRRRRAELAGPVSPTHEAPIEPLRNPPWRRRGA